MGSGVGVGASAGRAVGVGATPQGGDGVAVAQRSTAGTGDTANAVARSDASSAIRTALAAPHPTITPTISVRANTQTSLRIILRRLIPRPDESVLPSQHYLRL